MDKNLEQKTRNVNKTINTESLSQSGKAVMAQAKEKVILMRKNFDGCIQRNPEKSVLIAAGVGIIIGAVTVAALMRKKCKE